MKTKIFLALMLGSIFIFGCSDDLIRDLPPAEPPIKILIDSLLVNTATHYEIKNEGSYYRLYKEGEEFYIKGAAANAFYGKVDDFGGNTIRTYSVNDTLATRQILDEAYYNGISVMLGIWISRVRDGFDYNNAIAVQAQYDQCEAWVKQFKDHPAVMMWALGNELNTVDPLVWGKINDIGEMINRIDSMHPVTTVLPGTQIPIIQIIADSCSSFALLGINAYEGPVSNIQSKLLEAGWDKPYVVTELGPRGTWDGQVPFTSWGSTQGAGLIELTSTEKASSYENILRNDIIPYYNTAVSCLGSFPFVWGYQDRGTVITWYSMFNRLGMALESAHTMRYMYTSSKSSNLPPRIEYGSDLKINGKIAVESVMTSTAATNTANVDAYDPDGDNLTYEWIVCREGISFDRDNQNFEGSLPMADGVEITPNGASVTFKVTQEGNYRLNCFVFDGNDNAAHASFPFYVSFKEDENRTPKSVSHYSDISLGMQANTDLPQFLDAETIDKFFYSAQEPYGINYAAVIDISFYRSSSVGCCLAAPSNSDAAQFIYKAPLGFGAWTPRNNTQFALADPDDFSKDDFINATDDGKIYDIFHNSSLSNTIKNLTTDDVVLFKTVDGSYGAILIKEFVNAVDGTLSFDLLVN